MPTIRSASTFHSAIIRWYSRHGRSFAWRRTRQPYRILLSEIMSQQTQVDRVAEYYRRWLELFPTFSSLAAAPSADVLRAWSGLGYNNRALRLHSLAKTVAIEYRSRLPKDIDELQKLPGIGRYTAHAVACFAFDRDVPVVDVNIRRILTRWTTPVKRSSEQMSEERAWKTAEQFLPRSNVYTWNQALMDLGGLICTARKPRCTECPVASMCRSALSKAFLHNEPRKKKKEPQRKGIPRRIYRGKILKMVHHQALKAEEVAEQLWNVRSPDDVAWIADLLEKMRNEGLLTERRGRFSLSI